MFAGLSDRNAHVRKHHVRRPRFRGESTLEDRRGAWAGESTFSSRRAGDLVPFESEPLLAWFLELCLEALDSDPNELYVQYLIADGL